MDKNNTKNIDQNLVVDDGDRDRGEDMERPQDQEKSGSTEQLDREIR